MYADAASFLASGGDGGDSEEEGTNLVSVDVPRGLKAISEALVGCKGVEECFVTTPTEKAEEWIRSRAENGAGEKYRAFLRSHGHRCFKEVSMV